MIRIVIVGGGISGLTLAYRLEQRLPTAEVVVLEQQPRLGGKIETLQRDGFRVEAGPNGFLDTNPATARSLPRTRPRRPPDRRQRRRRPQPLSAAQRPAAPVARQPLVVPGSGVLSWRGKLNLLAERFRPPRRDDADESIDAFVRRRAGGEVAETLADAFVTGIYAGDPKLLSVRAAFPRLVRDGARTRQRPQRLRRRGRAKRKRGSRRREPAVCGPFERGLVC